MVKPQTLLEMANIQSTFRWKNSALVLVDYQNEYRTGKLPLFEIEGAIVETSKLLRQAREKEVPVIHVVHRGSKDGLFDLTASNGEIISELKPIGDEVRVEKTFPNSFTGTSLESTLRALPQVTNLVVAGLMTHMCLDSTVRSAVDHGFTAVIVASTTTTRDLKSVSGNVVSASDIKEAELAALQDRFALIVPTVADLGRGENELT